VAFARVPHITAFLPFGVFVLFYQSEQLEVSMKRGFCILACLSAISGCSSTSEQYLSVERMSPVEERISALAEVMVERANRVEQLKKAQYLNLTGNSFQTSEIDYLPILNQHKNLGKNYIGNLEPFIKRLSVVAGMEAPRFIGPKPSIDITLNIDTDYKTVYSMLEQAGTLAGSRADVVYKAAENLIEVKYPTR